MGGRNVNLLPCCCQCHLAPDDTDEFINVTRVASYNSAAPAPIPPYARYRYFIEDGTCKDYHSYVSPSCDVDGQPVCWDMGYDRSVPSSQWVIPGIQDCTGEGGEMVSKIADNCYKKTGNKVSYRDNCKLYGWKGVQARAVWPGLFGFVNSGGACCPSGGQQQSKYSTVAMEFEILRDSTSNARASCSDPTAFYSSHIYTRVTGNQTATVDRYGNVTRTGSMSFVDYTTQDHGSGPVEDYYNSDCNPASHLGFSVVLATGDGISVCDNASDIVIRLDDLWAECGVITWRGQLGEGLLSRGTAAELNALELYRPIADQTQGASGTPEGQNYTITSLGDESPAIFALSDNELSMDIQINKSVSRNKLCIGGPYDVLRDTDSTLLFKYHQKITLSGEITFDEVKADAEELLGEWDLSDDAQYPWRTDAKTWLQPLVSRDAAPTSPLLDWSMNADCEFRNEVYYSGEIRGTPLPAGYGRHFNFWHINWIAASYFSICSACEESYGAESPTEIPPTATQWTDLFDGQAAFGPGAHLIQGFYTGYGDVAPFITSDVVYAQKWAETLEAWPSINFSRACGRDRYLFDETDVACGSITGTDLTLTEEPDTAFSAGDKVATPDGVFEIVSGSGSAYVVSAKLYDTPVTCDGISKLRFPSARAICSTLAATAVQTSPGLITVTTPSKHWLKAGGSEQDTITFTGIGGLTTAACTVVDDTTFTVSGTLTTSPSTGTISQGATPEEIAFDTTCTTHNFIHSTWLRNRDVPIATAAEAEYQLEPTSRHPTVLYCTPNGETFPHGQAFDWGDINADQCYGEEWHCTFTQAVPDPFWQADHYPCGGSGTWTEASQPCETLDANHYAYPPLVEPRLVKPAGAPDLPVTLHVAPYMPGNVSHPNCETEPYGRTTPHFVRTAWLTCDDWKEKIGHKC